MKLLIFLTAILASYQATRAIAARVHETLAYQKEDLQKKSRSLSRIVKSLTTN